MRSTERGEYSSHLLIPRPPCFCSGSSARSKRSARRGIVPEVLERFRQGTGVTGLDEESVHPVAETLGALSDAGCNHGQAGGEVLGKLQRRVVESAIPLGQDQRQLHCRSVR